MKQSLLLMLVVVFTSSCHQYKSPAVAKTYAIANAHLTAPVAIVTAERVHDGGSIQLTLRDAARRELRIVYHTPAGAAASVAELQQYVRDTHHFYAGGFPDEPSARLLEPGGADETELKQLLTDCISRASSDGSRLVKPQTVQDASVSELGAGTDGLVLSLLDGLSREISETTQQRPRPTNTRAN